MAQNDIEPTGGFIDKRRVSKAGTSTTPNSNPSNYGSVGALRTRLTAINAGYYTAARLDQMSKNDMVFALRLSDDYNSLWGIV